MRIIFNLFLLLLVVCAALGAPKAYYENQVSDDLSPQPKGLKLRGLKREAKRQMGRPWTNPT